MLLKINNNRTEIYDADAFILGIIDKELRYPTIVVKYQAPLLGDSNWDGWVRLLHLRKTGPPWFPTGLVPTVLKIGERFNYPISIDDTRDKPDMGFPELVKIPLRDYQKSAVQEALKAGRGVLDMPPRSGKTRTMCELVRCIALPTVWIAPTDRIVTQTQAVLTGFFGKTFSAHLIGASNYEKVLTTPVVVCTAATAALLPDDFYQSRQLIVIDEFHHSSADSYRKIFSKCDHIYYRYGMTGTFFRSGEDAMAMHALLSNTIYKVSSAELLKRGYLVPTYVAFIPVVASLLKGLDTSFQSGHGKFGIHEHVLRNQLVSFCTLSLYKAGRKVLILVGTKKQGRLIQEILLKFLPPSPEKSEFKPVEFVSTDIDRSVQGRILKSFEEGQEVKILIGTTLLGEGVDLPSTDSLVYARGEQAEVGLTQAMYRVGTAVEGKKQALLVDFADRHNKKLMQHSKERLRVYYSEETFHVSVLDDSQVIDRWIKDVLLLGNSTL